jgi:hypothetical protein
LGEGGTTVIKDEPNPGLAVVKNLIFGKQRGKKDGYFLLMDCSRVSGEGDR